MKTEEKKNLKDLLTEMEGHLRILGLSERKKDWSRITHLLGLITQLRGLLLGEVLVSTSEDSEKTIQDLSGLAYVSKSNVPESEIAQECRRILAGAKERNMSCGVTGFLVYRAGYFVQILEGPAASLELIYSRIVLDPRHGQLRVLYKGPLESRNFGRWSMEYSIATSHEDLDLQSRLIERLQKDSNRLSPREVLSLVYFLKAYSNRKV